MVNWDSLKTAESGWRLDAAQRQRIYDNCLRGERIGGFQWQFVWKPAAYLAAAAAVFMIALFLWQQRDGAEKIIVPGSPGAKPAPYVENETDVSEPNGTEQPDVYYEPEDGNLDVEGPAVDSESPAVDSESTSEEQGIVKFWETVPEMSLDEAKKIIEEKLQIIEKSGSLGILTDEERMALYVMGCQYTSELSKLYTQTPFLEDFVFSVEMNADFSGDVQEFFEEHDWKKQEFASEYATLLDTSYTVDKAKENYKRNATVGVTYDKYFEVLQSSDRTKISHPQDGIDIRISDRNNTQGSTDFVYGLHPITELQREILKYYLSIKEIAFLEGPMYDECMIINYDE